VFFKQRAVANTLVEAVNKTSYLSFSKQLLNNYIHDKRSKLNASLISEHKKGATKVASIITTSILKHEKYKKLNLLNQALLKYKIVFILDKFIEDIKPKSTKNNNIIEDEILTMPLDNLYFMPEDITANEQDDEKFDQSLDNLIYGKSPRRNVRGDIACCGDPDFIWAFYNLSVEGPNSRSVSQLSKLLNDNNIDVAPCDIVLYIKNIINDPIREEFLPKNPMTDKQREEAIKIIAPHINNKVPLKKNRQQKNQQWKCISFPEKFEKNRDKQISSVNRDSNFDRNSIINNNKEINLDDASRQWPDSNLTQNYQSNTFGITSINGNRINLLN
jgi:hypothetical protein